MTVKQYAKDLVPTKENPLSPKVKWGLVAGGGITLVVGILTAFGVEVPATVVSGAQTVVVGIFGIAAIDPARG